MHTEVRIDDSVIMIGGAPDGPEANVHVYVDNPEARFSAAKDAGAIVVREVELRDDGDVRGGVKDPGGTTWWLAREGSDPS